MTLVICREQYRIIIKQLKLIHNMQRHLITGVMQSIILGDKEVHVQTGGKQLNLEIMKLMK